MMNLDDKDEAANPLVCTEGRSSSEVGEHGISIVEAYTDVERPLKLLMPHHAWFSSITFGQYHVLFWALFIPILILHRLHQLYH